MKASVAARSIAAFGVIVTSGFMLHAGSPSEWDWWKSMPVFGTWCLLPYFLILALSWRWRSSVAAQILLTVAAIVVTLPVPFLLYDAFVAHHSSTNALVFLFLPVYQLALVVPLSLAAWWAAHKRRSEGN